MFNKECVYWKNEFYVIKMQGTAIKIKELHLKSASWDSVIGTVTRLRAERSGVRIPAGTRDFFSLRPDRLWGSDSLLLNGYPSSFPGLERPGREVDHASPPSAEFKNKWRYTSAPPVRLYGADRDNFIFYLFYSS